MGVQYLNFPTFGEVKNRCRNSCLFSSSILIFNNKFTLLLISSKSIRFTLICNNGNNGGEPVTNVVQIYFFFGLFQIYLLEIYS